MWPPVGIGQRAQSSEALKRKPVRRLESICGKKRWHSGQPVGGGVCRRTFAHGTTGSAGFAGSSAARTTTEPRATGARAAGAAVSLARLHAKSLPLCVKTPCKYANQNAVRPAHARQDLHSGYASSFVETQYDDSVRKNPQRHSKKELPEQLWVPCLHGESGHLHRSNEARAERRRQKRVLPTDQATDRSEASSGARGRIIKSNRAHA